MNNFDDIKQLWQQSVVTPAYDATQLLQVIKKNRRTVGNRLLYESITLAAVFVWIAVLSQMYPFNHTQLIALGIVNILVIIFSALKFLQYRKLRHIDFAAPSSQALQQMHRLYSWMKWVNTKAFRMYAVILYIALTLYSYPFWLKFSPTEKIVWPIVYIAWFFIAVFYIQKKKVRKLERQMNAIIEELEKREAALREG